MNVREGMEVMVTHHMSNKGIVTEVYYVPVKHGAMSGTFSKQMMVKFISELDGQEKVFRASDLTLIK